MPMTAAEIRQSFFDFFREKQHTIVPSASLLPQSPGLLFTNAGMNPFVPYFLGVEKAPYNPPRAADTQKCIRAGGKHNDLEDVGYDTYHHTFFEMLGNWSFGDYFKKEAIQWAWELVVGRWGLPAHRLYASVYAPKSGDPGAFDQEAYDLWAALFRAAGCDPEIQIVHGNVKDNFWMMGETGPCGPCSELHVDLTPEGNPVTGRDLVNNDSDLCIEIWNLVFIQYNAEADGSFRELPSKHIDTGMGFERACSIIQNTKGFTDFSEKPSNYATDVFQPIFRKIEELSGKTYSNIYPQPGADRSAFTEEMKDAIAFRVIADHLRTLSFSIADGIMPGNNGRNYVLRRILRRAVRYGRQLGFSGDKPFFGELVETLVDQMGGVFQELMNRQAVIRQTLEQEEASFNHTLDRGLKMFDSSARIAIGKALKNQGFYTKFLESREDENGLIQVWSVYKKTDSGEDQCIEKISHEMLFANSWKQYATERPVLYGETVFELYDTFGFPSDLTELLCAERGLSVEMDRFEELMTQQRERARSARKSAVVRALDISTDVVTDFVGFEMDFCEATVLEVHEQPDAWLLITDKTPFYAEMGGQAGDSGSMKFYGESPEIQNVVNIGQARGFVLAKDNYAFMEENDEFPNGMHSLLGREVGLLVDKGRRRPIEAHHTATHLLHWALHEVVSPDAAQQGSSVDEHRLRFDFNSAAVTPEQVAAMEAKVNAAIQADDMVSWTEVKHADIKGRADIMQFFGDKYGDTVRVVQIGGKPADLTGYSMELCGGTHVRNTGAIGLFKIKSEGAIASGVRRIEAVTGEGALEFLRESVIAISEELAAIQAKLVPLNVKLAGISESIVTLDIPPAIDPDTLYQSGDIAQVNAALDAARASLEHSRQLAIDGEKRFKKLQASSAAQMADAALADLIGQGDPIVADFEADASLLQELQNGLKKKNFAGPAFLIVDDGEKLHLATYCGADALAAGLKAGDLLRDLAAIAGGKGGGKPDQARGAAPDRGKLEELKAAAKAKFAG